ncbi:MAG: YciI family protein [Rudaea sp.]
MKYFSIYIPDAQTNGGGPTPDGQAAMQKFVEGAISRGEFISGGGFLSLARHGAVVRRTHGENQVVDGPYAESKELIGGFAMLSYDSREAAIEGARRFLEVAGDGECLTYQIADGPHPEAH